MADYFPDYERDYVPPRKYFWDIFSTLNQELAEKFIDYAIKERNKQKVTQESKIEISAEIMVQIKKSISTQDKKEEYYLCLFQAEIFIRLMERERENINLMN